MICACRNIINPSPTEIKKNDWNNPFLELYIIIFKGNQEKKLKMVSQQYRAWSDYTDVQACLALLVAKTNHFLFQQDKGKDTMKVK